MAAGCSSSSLLHVPRESFVLLSVVFDNVCEYWTQTLRPDQIDPRMPSDARRPAPGGLKRLLDFNIRDCARGRIDEGATR